MPDRPDHPDREELAAWQAGDVGGDARSRVEAHLAACAGCTAVVGRLESVRRQLARLPEPELPAGFHERLAEAVGREAARLSPRRQGARSGRGAVWGAAAAAVLLLAAGLYGALRNAGGPAASGSVTAKQAAPPASRASLSIRSLGGDYASLGQVRDALAGRLQQATGPVAGATGPAGAGAQSTGPRTEIPGGAAPKVQGQEQPAAVDQPACIDQVRKRAGPSIRPSYFISTRIGGRAAIVLVTVDDSQPGRMQLWSFPDGSCRVPPTGPA